MKRLFLVIFTFLFISSTFAGTLECFSTYNKETFRFEQELSIHSSADMKLGKIKYVEKSIEDFEGTHSIDQIIAKFGDLYVSLWQRHPNIIEVLVYSYPFGERLNYLSQNFLVLSEDILSFKSATLIGGDVFDKISLNCKITK